VITQAGVWLGAFVLVVLLLALIRVIVGVFCGLRAKYSLLEITPAAFDDKPTEATGALFLCAAQSRRVA